MWLVTFGLLDFVMAKFVTTQMPDARMAESKSYGAVDTHDPAEGDSFDEQNLQYLGASGVNWRQFTRAAFPLVIAAALVAAFAYGMSLARDGCVRSSFSCGSFTSVFTVLFCSPAATAMSVTTRESGRTNPSCRHHHPAMAQTTVCPAPMETDTGPRPGARRIKNAPHCI